MNQETNTSIQSFVEEVRQGNRKSISRAITLLESENSEHKVKANQLMDALRRNNPRQGIRIGITGTPGVGKSTFIESLGMNLISDGLKVAVLAVDPTSMTSGGSILGDKTRMQNLSREKRAFIRSSPTVKQRGGIAKRTPETAFICEQAGFEVIIIETTGVGQTDYTVVDSTDVFVLLIAPEGGDELQGIKKGIMEVADILLINKADGELKNAANKTLAEYSAAMKLFQKKKNDHPGFPKITLISAQYNKGLNEAWNEIVSLVQWRKENGLWNHRRREQEVLRFRKELKEQFIKWLGDDQNIRDLQSNLEEKIRLGKEEPLLAVDQIIRTLKKSASFHLDK